MEGAGSEALTSVDEEPGEVNLAREFVEQARASTQYNANLRTLETTLDMRGSLIDLLA